MPKFAKTDAEADASLREFCDSIDFDPEWITPEQWATTIRIARDKDTGYEEAQKSIIGDRDDMAKASAKKVRLERLNGDASDLLDTVEGDPVFNGSIVLDVLKECAQAYVGGQRVNLGLGGSPMHSSRYAELRKLWDKAAKRAVGGVFTDFMSHAPQDKAALGKGNVGDTLDRRGVQGNLLVRIDGVRFNMHINIAS
ncbi:hypothetical protein [Streptomyces cucumeris]|uniref:hypothetical protein n=1 Tax=Streptomyces cucumeris TaxID=2962890 RepID=UPI0020C8AE54|nr:hypothetical protein [Streptomyces sp. NEAU-Y11]MCP9206551.1 hypothetical protein [Streptomyces sp. NEAU-Y11]